MIKEEYQYQTKPPLVDEILIKILKSWKVRGKNSKYVPDDITHAAGWWISHQEQANEKMDRPERINDQNGNCIGWKTPYHDRVSENLRTFLAMTELQKSYILQNIEAGVPYRGDNFEMYKMICDESLKMKSDTVKYIDNAKAKMHEILGVNYG